MTGRQSWRTESVADTPRSEAHQSRPAGLYGPPGARRTQLHAALLPPNFVVRWWRYHALRLRCRRPAGRAPLPVEAHFECSERADAQPKP
eukprot:363208-Chlamydomonas_euryale.AAC.4